MENVFDLANEDSGVIHSSDEAKASIAKLAQQQALLQDKVTSLEEALKEAKKDLQRVEEQDLPEAMDKIGMAEFKLVDGTKISIKTFYNASITSDRKPEAMAWLDDNGHGGIIKTDVSVAFSRGELDIARDFLEYARGFNNLSNEPELDQSVHWQTLRAFVKEQVEGGANFPQELFGVYIGRKAHIKRS